MSQVKRRRAVPQKVAATTPRTFRSFLLMQQFAAGEIGARIAQARKERGLTQEELAGMSSFSKRSLQDYETGVTIPYRHLQELGRLLHRPTEWFLYGEDVESSSSMGERLDRIQEDIAELRALLERQANS